MMLSRTLTALAVSASMTMSLIPTAFAELTSDEIISAQKSLIVADKCDEITGTLRGKCIGDVIKSIKKLRDDFKDALEIERTEWYAKNIVLGLGTEYTTALQAYVKSVNEKRKVFNTQQRELEKVFFTKQKAVRAGAANSSSSSRGFSQPLNSSDLDGVSAKCAKITSTSAKRMCLRIQLRSSNPNARQRGAAIRLTPEVSE